MKINRKAESNESIYKIVIYLIVILIFAVPLFVFMNSYKNNAFGYEDFYAKQTTEIINLAKPGDIIVLDVQKGSAIGIKNKVNLDEMFYFNNENKEVCVKFNLNERTCYPYFNNVIITENKIILGASVNTLSFKVERGNNAA